MKELDVVKIKVAVGSLPVESEGTIVLAYPGSDMFCIEFISKVDGGSILLDLHRDKLELVWES